MQAKHPQLRVRDYEVYFDGENARLFERVADAYHFKIAGVPTIFLGNDALTGFSDEMAPTLEAKIEHCIEQHCGSPLDRIAATARTRTLTFSAVVFAAAVDAINPCAFAVLIILHGAWGRIAPQGASSFAVDGPRRCQDCGAFPGFSGTLWLPISFT
jgi:hypothetical protein